MLKTKSSSRTVESKISPSSFMVIGSIQSQRRRTPRGGAVGGRHDVVSTPSHHVVSLGMRRFFMMLAATLLKILTRSVKFGLALDEHPVLPSVE